MKIDGAWWTAMDSDMQADGGSDTVDRLEGAVFVAAGWRSESLIPGDDVRLDALVERIELLDEVTSGLQRSRHHRTELVDAWIHAAHGLLGDDTRCDEYGQMSTLRAVLQFMVGRDVDYGHDDVLRLGEGRFF